MNLRDLFHRQPMSRLPQLPLIEADDETPWAQERLERLLTPTELDLVLRHRV